VRWDNLTVEADKEARLPGYRDPAVIRTFDAPEALDTRFYEVRAKSALNRVPEKSRMPFRWTINPYRGCTHSCAYCLGSETPVLTGDGRHKPIADLDVGDQIYGTSRVGGKYRKYTPTTVLDKWITIKPAYRVTLEDGTELVASGDHRFLSDRGWKHVTGAERGPDCRPHLTTNNHLVGTGRFESLPADTPDYRRGYLCGLIRGDGHVGSYSYTRPGRTVDDHHRFRLALTDLEALRRARDYLARADVLTEEFAFSAATGTRRAATAIRTSADSRVAAVRELIEWPILPGLDWCRGFLAGIFDAEGSRSAFALRIANTDPEIIGWTTACLKRLGFQVARDRTRNENGLVYVRIVGGLADHLRFFHLTDPAITRKRSIDGQMVKTFSNLRVASIEPLGRALPLYDITTGTGDFIANGVVSHNCFARPTHTYLDFDAGRDFEREIVVKVNAPEVLRTELARPSWKHEHVAIGTNTDPYQWVEGRYKLMPEIWAALRDACNPCSVLTKSPLLLRDIDLFKQLVERTEFTAALSVPTLEEKAWRSTEPRTPHPRARLEAVAELNRNGIPTGILIAPLMPGINDDPRQVEKILELAREAGAVSIGGIALHLRGEVRDVFFEWLRAHRPDLVPRYEALYRRGAYAPPDQRERLAALVHDRDGPSRWRNAGGPDERRRPAPARLRPEERQAKLF
jgi:DNA repair photolyase